MPPSTVPAVRISCLAHDILVTFSRGWQLLISLASGELAYS